MGTYSKLTYHVVFSTKYRRRTISDDLRERLYEYMGGIVRNLNGNLVEIGGIEDHLHLLVNLSPAKSVSDDTKLISTFNICSRRNIMVSRCRPFAVNDIAYFLGRVSRFRGLASILGTLR